MDFNGLLFMIYERKNIRRPGSRKKNNWSMTCGLFLVETHSPLIMSI